MDSKNLPIGLLNDQEILELCNQNPPLIDPFLSEQSNIRPSYGVSSFGYDIRLGKVWYEPKTTNIHHVTVDSDKPQLSELFIRKEGNYLEIPGHGFVLASSLERFNIPDNIFGWVLGKSTLARLGVVVNITPLEPGWRGILTIELANTAPYKVKLYAGRGIAQITFFRGREPMRTYQTKSPGFPNGAYQGQDGPTFPR